MSLGLLSSQCIPSEVPSKFLLRTRFLEFVIDYARFCSGFVVSPKHVPNKSAVLPIDPQ